MIRPAPIPLAIALLTMLAPPAGARRPPPLGAEIRLPLADPIVSATLGDVQLRLRVDFDRRDAIELNPAAAARLPLMFERVADSDVGRVKLPARAAMARLTVAGREIEAKLLAHDRDCCSGADGAIGASLLPFELVTLTGAHPGAPGAETVLAMQYDKQTGLEFRQETPAGALMIQFSLERIGTIASKSAGTILARAYHGRLDPGYAHIAGPFGIERPIRTLRLPFPALIAGFPVSVVQVRTADFGGRRSFVEEAPRPGDIVVRKRSQAAPDWPSLLLGRDYLAGCSRILFWTQSRQLGLRCPARP